MGEEVEKKEEGEDLLHQVQEVPQEFQEMPSKREAPGQPPLSPLDSSSTRTVESQHVDSRELGPSSDAQGQRRGRALSSQDSESTRDSLPETYLDSKNLTLESLISFDS